MRHRRKGWWSGHLHVMWHWHRMHRVASALSFGADSAPRCGVARIGFSRCMVTLLGVAQSRSGNCRSLWVGVGRRRSHGLGRVGRCALPFGACVSVSTRLIGARSTGVRAGFAASEAMPPFSCPHCSSSTTASHNMSIDADPQQQEAAPPLVLVVRSSSRSTATGPVPKLA